MKNLTSKISRRLLVFTAALAVGGFFFFNPNTVSAQGGGIEDTWSGSAGDCIGAPSDCFDTLVIMM